MDPVISPWVIYMLGILPALLLFFKTMTIICATGVGIYLFILLFTLPTTTEEYKRIREFWKWYPKFLVVSSVLFFFLYAAIPTQETVIGMVVANKITYDVLEDGKKMTKDAIDVGKDVALDVREMVKMDIIEIVKETMSAMRKDKEERKNEINQLQELAEKHGLEIKEK